MIMRRVGTNAFEIIQDKLGQRLGFTTIEHSVAI